ncbi:hypothetical protein [Streptomyces sp. LN245]|uniref:hypothetical protein n=1 Tax=Streptomyces sp. LN245 TaxID=3112975 RepID=UPI00371DD11A
MDQPGQQGGAAPTISNTFVGLDPADQHTVLTAGLTHLITARGRARRNGTAPDTGIDTLFVRDGKFVLVQCKHADTTTPPTTNTAPAPVY